ncbi:hypothetical protein DEIPH_ctg017orf0113 [Deinococcus phoenicis]|uniref:Uncharacterized protein n=1 Tax=Deinococcus phoenicis TaxID=1476583 RepID=A0A016QRZ7_9DEIO|nr:hypothetical protein DEIPH_ctg017orf0113 [Deinococcus phoenicis]
MLLLGLLGLNAWAGACDPVPASPAFLQAAGRLGQATHANQEACQGKPKLGCTAYALPPEQVARLILKTAQESGTSGAVVGEKASIRLTRSGGGWNVTQSVQFGRTTRIRAISGGSVAETADLETAYEQLSARLNRASRWAALWWNCTLAGLRGPSAFAVKNCRWVPATGKWPRTFDFTVTRANDRSLPPGPYSWYPPDGGSCLGGRPFRKTDLY